MFVRPPDAMRRSQARGVAFAVRGMCHHIKCMLVWDVHNMELMQVRCKPVDPYHLTSYFVCGYLDVLDIVSNGSHIKGYVHDTCIRAVLFLHACVGFITWDSAARRQPELHCGTSGTLSARHCHRLSYRCAGVCLL